MTSTKINLAYQHCLTMARNHYENFPVASRLLPSHLRKPIAAIYAFSRQADDIADEGNLSNAQRQQQLDQQADKLRAIEAGNVPDEAIYIALADSIQRFALPMQYFYDLISAFQQDIEKKRYDDFGQLMNYCRRSANPVGRLLLHLNQLTDRQSLAYSDAICSALQLINFYQDMHQDYTEMGRIYIPLDEMAKHHIDESYFAEKKSDTAMQTLMRAQIHRCRQLLNAGSPLGKRLKGRMGFEMRLIIAAATRIILKLESQKDFFSRPRLKFSDGLWIFWRAIKGTF